MILLSTVARQHGGPGPVFFSIPYVFAEGTMVTQTQLDQFDEPSAAKSKPRALVVDDAPDVTEMVAILLQYAGYEVVMAYSAPQALEAARTGQFDVLVSDIGMPGMNGYELAETLRRMPDYQSTPMVAVTGFSIYDDRDRARESGFDAFLTKPINPQDLISIIERLRG